MLWIERFQIFEELRASVGAFGRTYNRHWMIERHGYLIPTGAREELHARTAATA